MYVCAFMCICLSISFCILSQCAWVCMHVHINCTTKYHVCMHPYISMSVNTDCYITLTHSCFATFCNRDQTTFILINKMWCAAFNFNFFCNSLKTAYGYECESVCSSLCKQKFSLTLSVWHDRKISHTTGKHLTWQRKITQQEKISLDRKIFHMTGRHLTQQEYKQENISHDRKTFHTVS